MNVLSHCLKLLMLRLLHLNITTQTHKREITEDKHTTEQIVKLKSFLVTYLKTFVQEIASSLKPKFILIWETPVSDQEHKRLWTRKSCTEIKETHNKTHKHRHVCLDAL